YEDGQDVDETGNVPRPAWVQRAVAMLGPDGKYAHTTTYRQADPDDGSSWECAADDCDMAWVLGGYAATPSEHEMRYCPGCGRRITAEEPWGDGDE
ncbi:MAG TPA: hypothetical protein VK054_06965, partial [Beutenbergiaceae bacterium]|nr:hypothetical protein [Beutenbergiaceae bacterium]